MLTKIGKILGIPLLILIFYILLIKTFPIAGNKIDEITGTKISANTSKKIDEIFEDIGWIKNDTDSFIEGVGTNTKNRSREYHGELNEIKNGSR